MDRSNLAEDFLDQATLCERLGSPLYASLLQFAAQDIQSGGPCWRFLEPFAAEPFGADPARTLLPLRFLALFHMLALEGSLPELARYYPSCSGLADAEGAWRSIRPALERQSGDWRERLPARVQTNEVGRCCALLPGFAAIAERTALPLRLLEIGCSAGLNLRWDQYRYETGDTAWGDLQSPVVFRHRFANEIRWPRPIQIVERRGCDLNPFALDESSQLSLLSFVWADQVERFRRLSAALLVASRVPAMLDNADAVDWVTARLSKTRSGSATVLFHSIVWSYLHEESQRRLQSVIENAGAGSTEECPLAWLRMEPGQSDADITLTLWPPGKTVTVARSDYHGNRVEVFADSLQTLSPGPRII